MARYKIIAHLINPSLQDDKTLTDEYINDYNFIRNGGKQAIGYFMEKYPIDSNAYENLNSTNEYEIEEDADGVYLFKKCENVTESKRKKVKLTESQLKQIVAESVERVLSEMVLSESLASGKLTNYAQKHQGIKEIASLNPWVRTKIDVSQIPDEQIQDIFPCTRETLGNLARQIQNGVTIFFNDGTMAAVQISGNNTPLSSRGNPNNLGGESYDGQYARPSYRMQRFRNNLANTNPEARRQMANVLNKTRGKYYNL